MSSLQGRAFIALLLLLVVLSLLLGLLVGGSGLPVGDALQALAGRGTDGARAIVWELRAPRVALGFLVGGGLAVSGASLQALVRNPLADPYLLGLSGGASLGAVLAIVAGIQSALAMPLFAFAGAIGAMIAVYRLALVAGDELDSRVLLLAGVVIGADVARTKRRLYVAASLITAAAVAAAGIIGFIGLVVPHAIRFMRGHDYRILLPAAWLLGGAWLVAADAGARTLFAPMELPVGVVTAVVGVPIFALLLRRMAARTQP